MRLEVIASRDRLDAVAPAWWDLLGRTPFSNPFIAPDWLLPWCDELAPTQPARAVALYDGDDLVALVPFAIYADGEVPVLGLLGRAISDYQGAAFEDGHDEAIATVASLATDRALFEPGIARADLQELPDGDPLLAPAPHPCGEDRVDAQDVCPELALPATETELLDGLPHHLGPKLLRDQRRLQRLGTLTHERILSDGDEARLERRLDDLFTLHTARWRRRTLPGVLGDEAVRRFHRRVAHGLFRRGALRLFALDLDGRPLAVLYGFRLRDRFFSYLTGFDPAMASYSPGRQVIAEAMRGCIGEGVRTFDFLRGNEPYKYLWGARDRTNRRRRVLRST